MSTFEFVATELAVDEDEEFVCAGLAGRDPLEYLIFQRDVESAVQDAGVHFEFRTEGTEAYDCVRRCILTPQSMLVELNRPIDRKGNFEAVRASFDFGPDDFEELVDTLLRIFRDQESLLEVREAEAATP